MTVEIAYSNGQESVILADRRVTVGNKEEVRDIETKFAKAEGESYCGVFVGAGNADMVRSVLKNISDIKGKTADEFAENLAKYL